MGDFVKRGSTARPHIICLFISLVFEYLISSLDPYGAISLRSLSFTTVLLLNHCEFFVVTTFLF